MGLEMANDISEIIQYRLEKFDEPLDTSIKVVLLNYGDSQRIAHCIRGDWSGPKSEMGRHSSGLPICPSCGGSCTEEAESPRLALVEGITE